MASHTSTLRSFTRRRFWLCTLLCTTAPLSGQAQDSTDNLLGEVIVTAERRAQNLQDIAISASVFTAEDLSRKGVTNINDIQQVAPSIAINTFNRSTFINIRGVGIAQSAPTSSPGIAYYIDGQLIPHEQFIGQSFYDIDAVEVLRGPQGTLTGQNSTGGAIYVRTPAPVYDQYSGLVDLTLGDYSKVRAIGALNAGFNDNVALRISAVHDEHDSYTTNIGPSPSQPGNASLNAFRANFALRSDDERLNFNLRYDYFDYQTDNNAVKRRNDTVSTDPFVIQEDAISFLNQKGYRLSAEIRYDLTDRMQIRALSSWQDGYTKDQTDGDRTATAPPRPPAANVGRISYASTTFKTWINEINLLSTGDGPLQWVIGGFYMDEEVPVDLFRDNNNTVNFVSSTSTIQTRADNKSFSPFGQVNWFVSKNLELLAGVRYSEDTQDYTRFAVPGTGFTLPYLSTAESSETTGKLGVNYHFDGGTLVYGTVSKGYKAGGVNLTPNTPNFTPETNLVYEIGFKTDVIEKKLRVNGDVFRSDYQDIQLSSLVGGLPVTQNATSGESWGAELEATGQLNQFGFNVGVGYLQAEFSNSACISDTNAAGTDPGCPTNLRLVPEGRTLPFSPEWTINAGMQYEILLGADRSLTPRVQWSHLSEQNATPFPSANTIVPARDVMDARLTLDWNASLKLEAFVNNATDETYIASQIQNSSSADGGAIYGAPRTYGLRAVAKFGK